MRKLVSAVAFYVLCTLISPLILAGCGHIPSIETPQQYRHAVAEFVRG